jgi:hypothetical protein
MHTSRRVLLRSDFFALFERLGVDKVAEMLTLVLTTKLNILHKHVLIAAKTCLGECGKIQKKSRRIKATELVIELIRSNFNKVDKDSPRVRLALPLSFSNMCKTMSNLG